MKVFLFSAPDYSGPNESHGAVAIIASTREMAEGILQKQIKDSKVVNLLDPARWRDFNTEEKELEEGMVIYADSYYLPRLSFS